MAKITIVDTEDCSDDVWFPVESFRPKCDLTPNSFGVQLLIWPPIKEDGVSEMRSAFYGCRQSDEPDYYMYGRLLHGVTHFRRMPYGPNRQKT